MQKCSDPEIEVAENFRSIANILTSSNPNLSELKQRENLLKKTFTNVSELNLFGRLLTHATGLLLALQYVEKRLKLGRVNDEPRSLVSALERILNENAFRAVVHRHSLSVLSLLTLRYLAPESLVFFVSGSLSIADFQKIELLCNIPFVGQPGSEPILENWSSEVFRLAIELGDINLLEKWIAITPARDILESKLFQIIQSRSISEFSEVIRECCRKQDLLMNVLPLINLLLGTGKMEYILVGASFIGALYPSKESLEYFSSTKAILKGSYPLPLRLEFVESCLDLLDSPVTVTMPVAEWLLHATMFPEDLDSYCLTNTDLGDDELTPAGLRQRWLEIREDVRHIMRVFPHDEDFESVFRDMVCSLPSITSWKIQESILHACSSLNRKFPSLERPLFNFLRTLNPESTHRAVVNSLIVALTGFLRCVPEDDLSYLIQFALRCLASIPSTEPSGWFPLRSKQDNSCVVLLQAVAGSDRRIDLHALLSDLNQNIDGIKNVFYAKDSFRQSRTIFIRSLVGLFKKLGHRQPPLTELLSIICGDCLDISDFMHEATESLSLLFPLVRPLLDDFVRGNVTGIESLIGLCCEALSLEEVQNAMNISRSCAGFNVEHWIKVAPMIVKHHGGNFVVWFATIIPFNHVSQEWIQTCLARVPLDPARMSFHLHQLEGLLQVETQNDIFIPLGEYLISVLAAFGTDALYLLRPFLHLCVRRASQFYGSQSADFVIKCGHTVGLTILQSALLECFPKLPIESESLVRGVREGNNSKCRRIMKKLALALI